MNVPKAKRKRTPFGKVCGCLKGLSLAEVGGELMSSSSIGWLFEHGRDDFLEPLCA